MTIDEVLEILQSRKANLRCKEMAEMLQSLGFIVEPTRKGNHRKVKHYGLKEFRGSGFDCGHGKNPKVKPGYAMKMKQMLIENRTQLDMHLEREND